MSENSAATDIPDLNASLNGIPSEKLNFLRSSMLLYIPISKKPSTGRSGYLPIPASTQPVSNNKVFQMMESAKTRIVPFVSGFTVNYSLR